MLLANEAARAVLEAHLGALIDMPQVSMAADLPLVQAINNDLEELGE